MDHTYTAKALAGLIALVRGKEPARGRFDSLLAHGRAGGSSRLVRATSAAPFILRLAFRNLSRHRRRTALTIFALAFGIALMVLGQAWTDAMERAVVDPAKNATLGHVQIYRSDAAADETGEISFIMPQNNYRLISEPRRLIEEAKRIDARIESGLSRLMVGALLSFKDTTMDGVLIGIDARARASTYPALSVVEGRHFEPGEKGVLINRGVARKLGIGPGDDLVALGTTSDGRLNGTKLRVTGIYTIKGLEAYEWGSCYADLEGVQEILDVPEQAGLVVLRLKDSGRDADSVRDRLNAAFTDEGHERHRLHLGGHGRSVHRRDAGRPGSSPPS